jgi:hypothetical protein
MEINTTLHYHDLMLVFLLHKGMYIAAPSCSLNIFPELDVEIVDGNFISINVPVTFFGDRKSFVHLQHIR